MFQNSSNLEGGEKPPELHGASQGEVGGECLRGGWAALLHRAGAAHLAPGEVESHASGDPQATPRYLPHESGVTRGSQQVSHHLLLLRSCQLARVTVTGATASHRKLWGAEERSERILE